MSSPISLWIDDLDKTTLLCLCSINVWHAYNKVLWFFPSYKLKVIIGPPKVPHLYSLLNIYWQHILFFNIYAFGWCLYSHASSDAVAFSF